MIANYYYLLLQDIRKDFIRNEVVNFDLGLHIYGYITKNEYAARVQDPRTYHAISRDIVTRWVYPIVPEAQLVAGSSYSHWKRNVYKEASAKISRSARIGESVVLGKDSIIKEDASVNRTIIGRQCVIGAGSIVNESHIWEGVILEPNVQVSHAIICNGVVVKEGAKISRGCVLSYGVIVGAGVVLPEYTRVSLKKRLEEVSKYFFPLRSTRLYLPF